MNHLLKLAAPILALLAFAPASYADPLYTVTMDAVDINGSSLNAVTFNNNLILTMGLGTSGGEMYNGQTWDVYLYTINTSSSFQLQEDAFLYSEPAFWSTGYSNLEIQEDIWYISGALDYSSLDSNSKTLLTAADSAVTVADLPDANIPAFDNGYVSLLEPAVLGSSQYLLTDTQQAMYVPPAATPEPTSLLLLATGLFGFAGTYCKLKKA